MLSRKSSLHWKKKISHFLFLNNILSIEICFLFVFLALHFLTYIRL